MEKIRWAIVGTGYIANSFAQGMQVVQDARLAAVVSRSESSAKNFAARYGGEAIYTDYEAMLREVHPDVVYLAIPNDLHFSYILQALESNVNVLSEKPMVDTMRQWEYVHAKARQKGLFLMEGMWTRCFPVVRKVREWIAQGKIGDPLSVNVSFDIQPDYNDWQTWKAGIAHSGGALRDVGIYSLAVANMVFPEKPKRIDSVLHSNGEVDDSCRLLLSYGDGRTAYAAGAFNQNSDHWARIAGSKGRIVFGPEFWHPAEAALYNPDGTVERFEAPYKATGFEYEIMAVQQALREGKKECADFTHAESKLIAGIIEETRKYWGIEYKADREPACASVPTPTAKTVKPRNKNVEVVYEGKYNQSNDAYYDKYSNGLICLERLGGILTALKKNNATILGGRFENNEDFDDRLSVSIQNENHFYSYFFIELPCEERKVETVLIDISVLAFKRYTLILDMVFNTLTVIYTKKSPGDIMEKLLDDIWDELERVVPKAFRNR